MKLGIQFLEMVEKHIFEMNAYLLWSEILSEKSRDTALKLIHKKSIQCHNFKK